MNTRQSLRIGLRNSMQRKERKIQRILINNDLHSSCEYINSREESRTKFSSLRNATRYKTFELQDGTFVHLYVLSNHASEEEPWFILNDYASKICCDTNFDELMNSGISDEELVKHQVNGPVLLIRVDEDDKELKVDSSTLMYLSEYVN